MPQLIWILLIRIAVGSATHAGFLDALGHSSDIVGASRPERIYTLSNPKEVVDIGEDYDLNIEAILRLKPDVLTLTQYDFETKGAKQLERAGVKIIWISEWKETDPLKRAEWIKTFGALVGEEQKADSIFEEVSRNYQRLCEEHAKKGDKKKVQVLSGESYRGTWYVPTTNSYMGKLISDAGGVVAEGTGSKALTVEEVIRQFGKAEVWIGVQENSMAELLAVDAKHGWIEAYKQGRVYNWNKRVNAGGGNDFWETGVWRPDLILEDLMEMIKGEGERYALASSLTRRQ